MLYLLIVIIIIVFIAKSRSSANNQSDTDADIEKQNRILDEVNRTYGNIESYEQQLEPSDIKMIIGRILNRIFRIIVNHGGRRDETNDMCYQLWYIASNTSVFTSN